MNPSASQSRTVIMSIFIGLGVWVIIMLMAINWFQSRYIHEFTQHQPSFLEAHYTEQWFQQLLTTLPPRNANARLIQLWQPDCLCNRFARTHAISAMNVTATLGYEHITLIPDTHPEQVNALQALNPKTTIIPVNPQILISWPANPSVLVEGPSSELLYIGPLGFGAFCSQAATSVIENQLLGIASQTSRAFYNQIGQGCFCQWPDKK